MGTKPMVFPWDLIRLDHLLISSLSLIISASLSSIVLIFFCFRGLVNSECGVGPSSFIGMEDKYELECI